MLEPRQRTALDGVTWWCVFDTDINKWSTLTCFGKYRSRKACQYAILFEREKTKMRYNESCAVQFVQAIKTIASKPDNLANLECYLSYHFDEWMEKYATTPAMMASELKQFAEMEI